MNANRPQTAPARLPDALADDEYPRQRLEPLPRDPFYLPLADLRIVLMACGRQPFETVRDHRCGGSPDRGFSRGVQRYLRADYVDSPGIDFGIGDSGVLPLPGGPIMRTNRMQASIASVHVYPFVVVIEKRAERLDCLVSERHGSEWQPPVVIRGGYGKIKGRGD